MDRLMERVNNRETRRVISNMTDSELREAVKAIPDDVLIEEIWARKTFEANMISSMRKIANCSR